MVRRGSGARLCRNRRARWRTVGRGRVTLAGSFGRCGVGPRTRTDPMTPAKSSAGGRAGRPIRGAPEAVDRLPAGFAAPDFGSRGRGAPGSGRLGAEGD